jgi:hypothetical protein
VKAFFSEEKKQKTLSPLSRARHERRDSVAKVFWSFFSKKDFFLFFIAAIVLTACGKVGAPTQAGPADQITYPKTYPTQ